MQILGPFGGFMNHVRWLMWLTINNPTHHHSVMYPEEDVYLLAHRDGWPETLDEFNNLTYENLPKDVIINPVDKVEFISKNVYPIQRTKKNWLEYEWRYRNKIEIFCRVAHSVSDINIQDKTIVMDVDHNTANNHYRDMNPDCKPHTAESITQSYKDVNREWLFLKSEKLLNEILDKELYDTATEYFAIDNDYEGAKIVHKLWYDRIK